MILTIIFIGLILPTLVGLLIGTSVLKHFGINTLYIFSVVYSLILISLSRKWWYFLISAAIFIAITIALIFNLYGARDETIRLFVS